jgi:hypothetical protein
MLANWVPVYFQSKSLNNVPDKLWVKEENDEYFRNQCTLFSPGPYCVRNRPMLVTISLSDVKVESIHNSKLQDQLSA